MNKFEGNESLECSSINNFLATFGSVIYKGKELPRFRLVWSNDEKELRTGEYARYSGSVYLGCWKSTETVPKYSYLRDRYIIEQYLPPDISYCEELPDSKEGYWQALYPFESGKGDRLPLNMKVVEIIMYSKFNNSKTFNDKMKRMQAEQDRKDFEEQQYFEDYIDPSVMANDLHMGEAIQVPSNYEDSMSNQKQEKNDTSNNQRL